MPIVRDADSGPLERDVRRTGRVASFHSGLAPHRIPDTVIADRFARPLRNLRLSVTDRCNLRCEYCMPEDDYVWLPREDVLHFEETSALVDVFLSLGVDKIRLTGGEPLLRRDVSALVRMIAAKPGLSDLALTTNGVLLEDQIDALRAAGLGRITVSLDTLRRDRFKALTRFDQLDAVHRGIASAHRVYGSLKIDSVVIRGVNDDELVDLIAYGRSVNGEVRFIEYMDVGGANRWSPARVMSKTEMLAALTRAFGPVDAISDRAASAPAERFALRDGTTFGIIASTTEPFCSTCDRSRLTADGVWYLCLYATHGLDLRGPLRRGVPPAEIKAMIAERWTVRDDRGAEERLALGDRRAFVPVQDVLKRDPHLEMHTRGG
jgi:cyclic pyranopterin phosphate synthase